MRKTIDETGNIGVQLFLRKILDGTRKRFDYRVLTDNYRGGELRQMTEDLLQECFA